MFEHVVVNGTTYRHLSDLPPGFAVRIQPFANLSIWRNVPQDSDLVIRTVNVMPETWPSTRAQHLPMLPPSAVEAPRSAEAGTPTTSGRHAATALVELYVRHYNHTLSPAQADALIRQSTGKPEMVSEELSRLHSVNVQNHGTREWELKRINPGLRNDGSFWLMDIPQVLDVEIRTSQDEARSPAIGADFDVWYAVEYRRVVQYAANENLDINIHSTESSVRSGWTDDVPAAPPDQRKAFQDTVTGKKPLYTPTRLLTGNDTTLIITTLTIILVLLLTLVIVTVLLD